MQDEQHTTDAQDNTLANRQVQQFLRNGQADMVRLERDLTTFDKLFPNKKWWKMVFVLNTDVPERSEA